MLIAFGIDGRRVSVGVAKYQKHRSGQAVKGMKDRIRKWLSLLMGGGKFQRAKRFGRASQVRLEIVVKGLASEGIKVKGAKWGFTWNSCILTFGSAEDFEEAWSSRGRNSFLLDFHYYVGLPLLCWNVSFLEKLVSRWGKLVFPRVDGQKRGYGGGTSLSRVASFFDIQENVTLGSYGRSFKIKIIVGSVSTKQERFSAKNSIVVGDGEFRDEASSEEKDDRFSGGVGGLELLDVESRDSRQAAKGGQHLMLQEEEGQHSGVKVSDCPGKNLNLEGDYRGLGLRNDFFNECDKTLSEDLSEPNSNNSRISISGPAMNLNKLSYGKLKESWVEAVGEQQQHDMLEEVEVLVKEVSNVEEAKVVREAVTVPTGVCTLEMHRLEGGVVVLFLEYIEDLEKESIQPLPTILEGRPTEVEVEGGISNKSAVNNLQQARSVEEVGIGNQCDPVVRKENRRRRRLLTREALEALRRRLGGRFLNGGTFVTAVGSVGGLLVLWNDKDFEVSNSHLSGRFIAVFGKFKNSSEECVIINVYGPSIDSEKEEFFRDVGFCCCSNCGNLHWGDLNVYLDPAEKLGKSQNWLSIDILRNFLNQTNLIDLPMVGGRTYYLGPYLITILYYWRKNMLIGALNRSDFFNYLLEEEGFDDVVKLSLDNLRESKKRRGIFSFLQETKKSIRNWSGRKFYRISDSISELELKINDIEFTAQSSVLLNKRGSVMQFKSNLWRLYRIEESIWFQKSRARWIKDGDRNTRFFHLSALNRSKRNEITSLNFNGFVVSDPKVIKLHIAEKWEHGVNHALSRLFRRRLIRRPWRTLDLSPRSQSQFAFVPGRQLLDCAFIANERIDYRRKQGLQGVVLKVDFRRAYDSVEWPILFRAMAEMGFGNRWSSWISQCLSTASISILVNGSPSEKFPMAKGLRQGCSLSPLLFNIIGEMLHLMISRAVDRGLFQGFVIGKSENSARLSHLQFADDLIIFCQASLTQIKNVKNWAVQVGCSVGSFPTEYLGLPLGAKKNSEALWDPVFKNFSSKLVGWKASCLSLAGRTVLLKSVLTFLPIFFLSLFKMPCKIGKKLNSLLANFLWGDKEEKRKIHWVKWSTVCRPLNSGGLGVLDLNLTNRALLGYYSAIFLDLERYSNSFLKNDSEGECLRSNARLQVGNGTSILFGMMGEGCRVWVAWNRVVGCGNVETRRNLCDWELNQWMDFDV
ncbi:hypothetical protein F3Y22_tig00110419pilonHSYRG00004 [Hibiscus syriacus]|uniref:Reverse transcriptase domain-containing protein n=1 Tax=Hibiscus syriacus TaxID=106335 RepID=A0A6A3ALV7_HIBSY|nr:hypothetical protein F3Y22_tig00110419pilonHSYRG00004 [Hibiscus syriacus]